MAVFTMVIKQPPDPLRYQAYILRLWQERSSAPHQDSVWRFSLEDTFTRQRLGFADLEKMLSFLQTQVDDDDVQSIKRKK